MTRASAPAEHPPPRPLRRRIPVTGVPLMMGAACVYGVIASLNPFLGQSLIAVLTLSLLFWIAGSFMVLSPNPDRLDLFRVVSLYYLLSFCIGPLFVPAHGVYFFDSPRSSVLEAASLLALACYLCTAIGYYLPLFKRPAHVIPSHSSIRHGLVKTLSLGLFVIGVLSWIGLVQGAGGVGFLLFSDVARASFFSGRGFLFWPALFMVSGGVLYFAAQVHRHQSWRAAWPLVIAFLLLLLLQGRSRAVGPLLMGIAVAHYLIRPIRLVRFSLLAALGIFVLIVVGVARSPAIRADFVSNPVANTLAVANDVGYYLQGTLIVDVARIPEVMVVVDKVPDRMPYDYGASLVLFLNPLFRQLGALDAQLEPVGTRLYVLARPDLPPSGTGFLPSIVGEVRTNFPSVVTVPLFLLYGIGLRLIYQRLIVSRHDYISVALYAIIGLHAGSMVGASFGQKVFEVAVEVVPIFGIRMLARTKAPRPAFDRVAAGSESPSTDGAL